MKNEKLTGNLLILLVYTALIISILSSGCLSEPLSKVADFTSSFNQLQGENYYQVDTDELTIPDTAEPQTSIYEDIPEERTVSSPGFEISSYYLYTQFYQGSENAISVYVKNMGNTPIFVYQFGFLLVDDNELVLQSTGVTIEPDEEQKVGIISLQIPDDVEEIKIYPQMTILAQTTSGSWRDYNTQEFEEMSIEVSEKPSAQYPDYVINPENAFEQVNSKVDQSDVDVRTMAAASAKKFPGQYNIYQICALFDDTKENIEYISDPRGKDLWSTPGETIAIGAGDCDDYAILLSSLIEAIGGTSRIYLTDTHAFAAVYIGNDTEEIGNAIGNYYGQVPIYYTTDSYGSWLLLDPTSSMYAGGIAGGTAPIDDGWTFLNTTTVTVVDIAPLT